MPSQEDYLAEHEFAKSGGTVCPYCKFPVDDHAIYVEQMSEYAARCSLLRNEIARWVTVIEPQKQQQAH